jgi:preprotein translocase subunit SecD
MNRLGGVRLLCCRISLFIVLSVFASLAAAQEELPPPPAPRSHVHPALPGGARSFELRLAQKNAAKGLTAARHPNSNRRLYLQPTAIVTHRDVAEARAVRGRFDPSFNVEVTFSPEGSRRLAKATQQHVGRPLAILVNGRVVAAPEVRSISDTAVISGFTRIEAERLADDLLALAAKKPDR